MSALSPETPARHTLVIRPSHGWRALDLRELWDYRELLAIFVWRDLKVRYRQTILGALWIIGQPLLTMLVFTLLFHRIARIQPEGGTSYPLFVFSGLLIWNFVANGIAKAGNSLIGSSYLISRIYFPRVIIPLSNVVTEIADFGVASILLVILMIRDQVVPGPSLLLLPVPLVLACLLSFGVGLWIAALNVEYRDVRIAIPFVLQLAMYVTPIVYPLSAIPVRYQALAALNPMTGIVQTFRATLFNQPIPVNALAWSAVVAAICAVSGVYYFRRMERLFADIL